MSTQSANPQDSLQRLVSGTELEPRSCSERAPVRSGAGGGTVKRYWSTLTAMQMERMTKEEIIKAKEFDAKLTPEDVLEMQTIDADCNDCRHFKRGPMRKGLGIACFEGHCLKLDKPTLAWPMQYSGHECFEHRRAPVSSGGGGAEQVGDDAATKQSGACSANDGTQRPPVEGLSDSGTASPGGSLE